MSLAEVIGVESVKEQDKQTYLAYFRADNKTKHDPPNSLHAESRSYCSFMWRNPKLGLSAMPC